MTVVVPLQIQHMNSTGKNLCLLLLKKNNSHWISKFDPNLKSSHCLLRIIKMSNNDKDWTATEGINFQSVQNAQKFPEGYDPVNDHQRSWERRNAPVYVLLRISLPSIIGRPRFFQAQISKHPNINYRTLYQTEIFDSTSQKLSLNFELKIKPKEQYLKLEFSGLQPDQVDGLVHRIGMIELFHIQGKTNEDNSEELSSIATQDLDLAHEHYSSSATSFNSMFQSVMSEFSENKALRIKGREYIIDHDELTIVGKVPDVKLNNNNVQTSTQNEYRQLIHEMSNPKVSQSHISPIPLEKINKDIQNIKPNQNQSIGNRKIQQLPSKKQQTNLYTSSNSSDRSMDIDDLLTYKEPSLEALGVVLPQKDNLKLQNDQKPFDIHSQLIDPEFWKTKDTKEYLRYLNDVIIAMKRETKEDLNKVKKLSELIDKQRSNISPINKKHTMIEKDEYLYEKQENYKKELSYPSKPIYSPDISNIESEKFVYDEPKDIDPEIVESDSDEVSTEVTHISNSYNRLSLHSHDSISVKSKQNLNQPNQIPITRYEDPINPLQVSNFPSNINSPRSHSLRKYSEQYHWRHRIAPDPPQPKNRNSYSEIHSSKAKYPKTTEYL